MDLTEFLSEFQLEAGEKLDAIATQLLRLERDSGNPQPVREMFLAAHTIKGGAAMMRLTEVEVLAHALEDSLSSFREHQRTLDGAMADLLFQAIDQLRALIAAASPASVAREPDVRLMGFVARLRAGTTGAAPAALPASEARRAMVVDESATVRELYRMLLEDAGFEVETSADGRVALLGAESLDLIVAGLQSATLDGFELCAALRARGVRVVLMSAEPSSELTRKASQCGAQALIRKGSLRDDFQAANVAGGA
jgi:chemotaxis protein histidine kinase CheA